jgi:hypothetical protein
VAPDYPEHRCTAAGLRGRVRGEHPTRLTVRLGTQGERSRDWFPNYGKNLSVCAALSLDGITAVMSIEGAIDGVALTSTSRSSWSRP